MPIGTTWSGAVAGSVTRAYDNDFRVASLSVNGGSPIALTYDAGRFAHAGRRSDPDAKRAEWAGHCHSAGFGHRHDDLRYLRRPGDLHRQPRRQCGLLRRRIPGTLSAASRRRVETIGGVTHTFAYTYDLAGRLTEVRQDNVLTASYTYDPNGNRLSRTDGGGTVTATYDAQDRLEQFGATTYVHNAAGERQSKTAAGETTSYQYDSLGNLTGVTLPGGAQIEYVLDGRQRRVGKKVNGALVQGFLYQDALASRSPNWTAATTWSAGSSTPTASMSRPT